ncbi:zinc finger protein 800 [Pelodytes ibericus]
MEKKYNTLWKTHFLRNKGKNETHTLEMKLPTQKMSVKDKSCQTDHHHGCCKPVPLLEPGDPPLLQQPVQTAKSGIQQIIECFRSGTTQLKHILLKEVDTIFECKSCRSLFRGLPNLITHKQFYCLSTLRVDENESNERDKPSQSTKEPEYVINLEPIKTNGNAVFQFVTPVGETSSSRNNVSELASVQMEEALSVAKPNLTPETEFEEPPSAESVKMEASFNIPTEVQKQLSGCAAKPGKAIDEHPFLCRVCKKTFHCRRSIRRHIKKVHKKKLEDIKKFIEVQKKPTPNAKGHIQIGHMASSTRCHVCNKCFATKANVRRHLDEVHKGLKRDSITPETTARSGKNVPESTASPKKSLNSRTPKSVNADFSLSLCKCPYCKRRYTSQYLLKKHVLIVHKTSLSSADLKLECAANNEKEKAGSSNSVISPSSGSHSPQNELKSTNHANEKKSNPTQKNKIKIDPCSPKTSPPVALIKKNIKKPRLSVGFDFKQLYCKLCKRQFTSKQNLAKHIELHTDGSSIYVKFYRCPLCSYETRRKRDVIRHITVVHKRTQRALVKITANLESRAIKKPIETILEKVGKRGPKKKSKIVGSKQDGGTLVSPSKKCDGGNSSLVVKVTKSFSLLKCNICAKAFAKKTDLNQHKKVHKNNSPVEGRSTRSKTTA